MTNYLTLRINAVHARSLFGLMMWRWYCRNGWQPWTLNSWAESNGFPSIPYGKMADIYNGTAGILQREHFEGLGEVNRRLATKEFGAFANARTANAIAGSRAILHKDGQPWSTSDFWACYCGLLEPVEP